MWGGEIRRYILQTRCISNSLTSVSYLKKSFLFFLNHHDVVFKYIPYWWISISQVYHAPR